MMGREGKKICKNRGTRLLRCVAHTRESYRERINRRRRLRPGGRQSTESKIDDIVTKKNGGY